MTVRVSNLSKQYGRDAVLAGIDLAVANGEFLALLGPSGAGKTTLLRLIAGLDVPDQGRILIDETELRTLPPRERRIGFVFQNYALFRHMNVADNIAFGLTVKPRRSRPSRHAIAARVAELLDLMQLPGLGHRFPAQLSGGQRQRVALARALALDPKVLLLDEPFGALDAKVRAELREWLQQLQQQLRLTTILVTHDRQEAFQLADRVAILQAGRVEQVGTVSEIKAKPATRFVAEFLDIPFNAPVPNVLAPDSDEANIPLPTTMVSPPPDAIISLRAISRENVTRALFPRPHDARPTTPDSAAKGLPGCARNKNAADAIGAGDIWLIAVSSSAPPLSPSQEAALKTANVIVYDRHLSEVVSKVLPLGHYAEPAGGNARERCLEFAREGWSVVRLIDAQRVEGPMPDTDTAARTGSSVTAMPAHATSMTLQRSDAFHLQRAR